MDSRSGDCPDIKLRSNNIMKIPSQYYTIVLKTVTCNACLINLLVLHVITVMFCDVRQYSLCNLVIRETRHFNGQG